MTSLSRVRHPLVWSLAWQIRRVDGSASSEGDATAPWITRADDSIDPDRVFRGRLAPVDLVLSVVNGERRWGRSQPTTLVAVVADPGGELGARVEAGESVQGLDAVLRAGDPRDDLAAHAAIHLVGRRWVRAERSVEITLRTPDAFDTDLAEHAGSYGGFGGCLAFGTGGFGDRVEVSSPPPVGNAFEVEVVIEASQPATGGAQVLVERGISSLANGLVVDWGLWIDGGGRVRWRVVGELGTVEVSAPDPLTAGERLRVSALVGDSPGPTVELWLAGELVALAPWTGGTVRATAWPLRIGGAFQGKLDDVRVFTGTPRTEAERRAAAWRPLDVDAVNPSHGLALYLPLDVVFAGTVYDESGNDRDGRIVGSVEASSLFEGGHDLAGRRRPVALGEVDRVPSVVVDRRVFAETRQVHHGSIRGIAVDEGGRPLGRRVTGWTSTHLEIVGGDDEAAAWILSHDSALVLAGLVAGQWIEITGAGPSNGVYPVVARSTADRIPLGVAPPPRAPGPSITLRTAGWSAEGTDFRFIGSTSTIATAATDLSGLLAGTVLQVSGTGASDQPSALTLAADSNTNSLAVLESLVSQGPGSFVRLATPGDVWDVWPDEGRGLVHFQRAPSAPVACRVWAGESTPRALVDELAVTYGGWTGDIEGLNAYGDTLGLWVGPGDNPEDGYPVARALDRVAQSVGASWGAALDDERLDAVVWSAPDPVEAAALVLDESVLLDLKVDGGAEPIDGLVLTYAQNRVSLHDDAAVGSADPSIVERARLSSREVEAVADPTISERFPEAETTREGPTLHQVGADARAEAQRRYDLGAAGDVRYRAVVPWIPELLEVRHRSITLDPRAWLPASSPVAVRLVAVTVRHDRMTLVLWRPR